MKRFDQTVDIPQVQRDLPPGVGQVQRNVPTRAPEVSGDVLVPLLRAIISGAFLALLAAVLVLVWEWLPWYAAVLVGGAVSAVVWFGKGLSNKLLWATETITGADLDHDGNVGRPVVSVEVADLNHRQYRFMELPGTPEALQQLASGVLSGKTLAEAEWTGAGRPYTRNEFRDLRAQLVERGIAAWRNPQHPAQGVELTRPGRAVFAELARTHARAGTSRQIEPPTREVG